jgi:hypothetical protein
MNNGLCSKKLPAKQGICKDVGYKKPPEETQFKPGQSGNPAGPPKRRIQLWVYFCRYMNMTDAEIKKLDRKKLTLSQQTAMKIVENAAKGKYSGSERLARHVFNREEGKPTEYLVVGDNEDTLSDEKCEEIREILRKNLEAATHNKS